LNFLTGITTEIDASTTATTSLEWTAGGRIKKVTDPNGSVVETVYDERGLPFKIKEAPGTAIEGVTTINYDLNGHTAEVVDPRGNATAFAHDHGFRMVEVTFADTSSAAMAYDLSGRLVQSERKDTSGRAGPDRAAAGC
jgi:YD repeat-containing protein